MTEPSRVAIVDDHELVGLAVGSLIQAHEALAYAGHAETVEAVLAFSPRPDLVVLDLNLRGGSQPSANVDRIRAYGAEVLVLSSDEYLYLIREVSRAGLRPRRTSSARSPPPAPAYPSSPRSGPRRSTPTPTCARRR